MGPAAGRWAVLDDFSLKNLARSLYERVSKSKEPGVADEFRRRLLRVVDPEHRTEKYARFGSHAEFLDDVAYVHRATREANPYTVGNEFRCVLVGATVSTVYAQIPPEAVSAHIAIGSTVAAMNLASALQSPHDAARALLDVAQAASEVNRDQAEIAAGKAVALVRGIDPDEINLLEKATRADLLGHTLHVYQAMGARNRAAQTLRDALAGVADSSRPGTRSDEYAQLFAAALALGDRGVQESIQRRIKELEPVIDGPDRDHRPRVRGLLALCGECQRVGDLPCAESTLRDASEIIARADWGTGHEAHLKARTLESFATMVDWSSLSEGVASFVSRELCKTAIAIGRPEWLGTLALRQATRADGLAREVMIAYWQHGSPIGVADDDLVRHLRPGRSDGRALDEVLAATIVVETARAPKSLPRMLTVLSQHEQTTEFASLARLAQAFSNPLNVRGLKAVTAALETRILRSGEAVPFDVEELARLAAACHPASKRVSLRFLDEALRDSSMMSELNGVTLTLARDRPQLLAVAAPRIKARALTAKGAPSYAIEALVAAAASIAPKVAADIGTEAVRQFPAATRLQWSTVGALAAAGRKPEAVALVKRALASSACLDAIGDRLKAIEALIQALAACGDHSKAAALAAAGLASIDKVMLASTSDDASFVELSSRFVATALALPGTPNLATVESLAQGKGPERWRARIALECAQAYTDAGNIEKATTALRTCEELQGPFRGLDKVSVRYIQVAESAGRPGIQEHFARRLLTESESGRYFSAGDAALALVSIFDRGRNAGGLEILAGVQRNLEAANPYRAAELALSLGGATTWTAEQRIPLLNNAVAFFLSGSRVNIREAAEGVRRLHSLGAVDLAREHTRRLSVAAETIVYDGGLVAAGRKSDEFLRAEGLVVAAELFAQLGQDTTEARAALLRAEHIADDIKPDEEKTEIVPILLRGSVVLRDRERVRHYLEGMRGPAMSSAGDLAELLVTAQLSDELDFLLERVRSVTGYFERTRALGEIAPAFLKAGAPEKAVMAIRDALGGTYDASAFPVVRWVIFALLVNAVGIYQHLRDESALSSLADVVLEEDEWWPQARFTV